MAKHTKTTVEAMKAEDTRSAVPQGFDDLPAVTSSLDLQGWIRPAEDLHVYGELLSTVSRKEPRRNQSAKFLVIQLAMPMVGLILSDDRDADAEEGELEAGSNVGLDMRQAYSQLEGQTGRVHIHFIAKKELTDGNTWWETKVYFAPTTKPRGTEAPGPSGDPVIPF